MNKDIFLSYCHNDRSNVKKIYDGLGERGCKVWLDDVEMKGSRFDNAMMDGIECSVVFLTVVSSGYEGSDNCRDEYDYAEKKQKNVVIFIVEEEYRMSGWIDFNLPKALCMRMSKKSLEELLDDVIENMSGKESVGKQAVSTKDIRRPISTDHNGEVGNVVSKMVWHPGVKELVKADDVGEQLLAPLTHKWDIFLSYCHKDRSDVKKIYDGLRERGYKVWLDDVEMKGGRVDNAMMDGINNSEVFLMAVSSGYQNSGSCRNEFDYAKKKQKNVVIVIVEEEYQMGGWMEFHLSNAHYMRMSKKSLEELLDDVIEAMKKPRP